MQLKTARSIVSNSPLDLRDDVYWRCKAQVRKARKLERQNRRKGRYR